MVSSVTTNPAPPFFFLQPRLLRSRHSYASSTHHHPLPLFSYPPLQKLSLPRLPTKPASRRSCSILALHSSSAAPELLFALQHALSQTPTSWQSSIAANAVIFALGFPILQTGLTLPGVSAAFFLGTVTWKAFGPRAFLLVALYFIMGTAVTKVKLKQKEKEGIAEKRSGKRGPPSVWGSGAAGIGCAIAAVFGVGGPAFYDLWKLGFTASFATKLSDTVSSEIGKAYGKTTYLVTTLKLVPRGTEGAISMEGTMAGLIASICLCGLSSVFGQITTYDAIICVVSSQIANLLESYIGATVQDRDGFEWLNNDVVNVLNISVGAILTIAVSSLYHLH